MYRLKSKRISLNKILLVCCYGSVLYSPRLKKKTWFFLRNSCVVCFSDSKSFFLFFFSWQPFSGLFKHQTSASLFHLHLWLEGINSFHESHFCVFVVWLLRSDLHTFLRNRLINEGQCVVLNPAITSPASCEGWGDLSCCCWPSSMDEL